MLTPLPPSPLSPQAAVRGLSAGSPGSKQIDDHLDFHGRQTRVWIPSSQKDPQEDAFK